MGEQLIIQPSWMTVLGIVKLTGDVEALMPVCKFVDDLMQYKELGASGVMITFVPNEEGLTLIKMEAVE